MKPSTLTRILDNLSCERKPRYGQLSAAEAEIVQMPVWLGSPCTRSCGRESDLAFRERLGRRLIAIFRGECDEA